MVRTTRRQRDGVGHPGVTHCGQWTPIPPRVKDWPGTRLVCVLPPHEGELHRSAAGFVWGANRRPRREKPTDGFSES